MYDVVMLIDEIAVTFAGGHGGAGRVSFGPMLRSGPDGGNGGKGGDIYVKVTSDLTALNQFSKNPNIKAEDGSSGFKNRTSGKGGDDLVVYLPIGTTMHSTNTSQVYELTDLSQEILVCRGGLGGRGNFEFKSSKNVTPDYAQPGLPGQEKHFRLILNFLAEYGLIGLPNSGKSSLLNELTRAKAQVGAYPFTTLEANLGSLHGKIIADIPGLIEGASEGRGLGTKFLKHIKKVKKLLHCITADSPNVLSEYKTINTELEKFDPDLVKKDRLILLTKTDIATPDQIKHQTDQLLVLGYPIYPVSIYDWDSLKRLEKVLLSQ